MSQPVRVRRLPDVEGRSLQRLVRALSPCDGGVCLGGREHVQAIARLVQTSPDRAREVIHRFNEMGMATLDPRWAGGRSRRITIDDESFIVETAKKRPAQVGAPFSHWSLRKLRRWLGECRDRPVVRPLTAGAAALLRKNGSCYVEQKNWAIVRQRSATPATRPTPSWPSSTSSTAALRLFTNFFCPRAKLIAKTRHGAKVSCRHDKPTTPYQRLLDSGVLTKTQGRQLTALYRNLNPAQLRRDITRQPTPTTRPVQPTHPHRMKGGDPHTPSGPFR